MYNDSIVLASGTVYEWLASAKHIALREMPFGEQHFEAQHCEHAQLTSGQRVPPPDESCHTSL